MPVPCQAPFGLRAGCSSSPRSPVIMYIVSTSQATHGITPFSLTPCFSGERWHWQVPSSETRPHAKPLTNTNCPSRTMLKARHLIVIWWVTQSAWCSVTGVTCHPPGTAFGTRFGMAFTSEFHIFRREMTQLTPALCLDFLVLPHSWVLTINLLLV